MRNKELMLKVAKKIDNKNSTSYNEEEFLEMFPELKQAIKKELQRRSFYRVNNNKYFN